MARCSSGPLMARWCFCCSEGPSGGSRAAAAVADGCREVVVPSGDCSRSACISATTIPVAELVDTWPPISREKDPQTLMRRDCPRWEGFPLVESEQGQTRAQLTQSTPCTCTWLSIGFLLKDDSCHRNEWEKSTFPGFSTFSAEMTSAKAL